MEEYVRVPQARIGVVIGKDGETRRKVEERLKVNLDIDTETGEVHIYSEEETEDPLAVWKGRDIIKAIARGFSPRKALRLLDDDTTLEVIDLEDYFGKSENSLRRVRGRIIGKSGMTRKIVENMTGTYVSVYGRTVSILGEFGDVADAKRAVDMLLQGCMHATVYKFLEELKKKRGIEDRASLWK